MRQVLGPGALGRPRGIGWRGRWEGGTGWGIHVNPWLIHVSVWQNPLKYCEVISFQLIKINEKNKNKIFVSLFWLCWTFVAACGFSPVATSRGYSSSWYAAFSVQWLLLVWSMRSRRRLQKLQHVGSKLSRGTWESSQIRYYTMYPTLTGRLLTTGPPGKPCCYFIYYQDCISICQQRPQSWHASRAWKLRICLGWSILPSQGALSSVPKKILGPQRKQGLPTSDGLSYTFECFPVQNLASQVAQW